MQSSDLDCSHGRAAGGFGQLETSMGGLVKRGNPSRKKKRRTTQRQQRQQQQQVLLQLQLLRQASLPRFSRSY